LRALAEHWTDCPALSEAELAERVRADRIDVLVDLAGHTSKSRLGTFALRPAPVQMTYLGYPNTTGLRAIDYRITDARADPPGESDTLHVERMLRLPKSFICYRPGGDAIPVAPPPAARTGTVTFGCFNNFQKLSDPFLDAAARALAAVPGARLLLKAKPLGLASVADDIRRRFRRRGIDPERLVLRGWAAKAENHLAAYDEVDIALDSFPYNGTTTTCEAMWMGVPVVTLQGDRHAACVGVSLLHSVGLNECIGRDVDDYVRIAAGLAADLPRLAALREGMRQRMRASPLMDEGGFVRDLERSYLEIWQARIAAVARMPEDAQALERLWNECHESGDHAAAIEALGRAIAADGKVARHHYMLGCTLQDAGRLEEAARAYGRALALEPGLAKAQNNLGCVLEAVGDGEGAMRCYEAALHIEPGLASALYNRGNMHKQRGDAAQAQADIGRALEIEPQHADWRCALGEALILQGKADAAIGAFRAALESNPLEVRAYNGMGGAQLVVGRPQDAESSFRRAVEIQSDHTSAHSNLLLAMHYSKGDDARVMYEAHLEWAGRHAGGLASHVAAAEVDRRPAGRLNIGYVSPNFQHHAVAWAIEPVLAAHDRNAIRTFFYSTVARPDAVTQRFMKLCDEWRDIHLLGNDDAARLIRQDGIDILVDLAGHTGGGRPLLFARKPAPLQVSWQGYPNTTGLAQMDYRITDAYADPEGDADLHYTEKLVRLATGFFCYAPPPDAPEPGAPPALASGRVTFGCFNNLAKVTPEMIGLWSRILVALPQSRMIMKAHALSEDSARRAVHGHFAANGIDAGRVELFGPVASHGGHLGAYRDIDIALDPFPYQGTATTCEALWMGVPVVALAGRTHLSRVSVSVLHRVGLEDWIAATPEEYVRKAIEMAQDPARLRELRAGLRQRMRASPLLDATAFARSLEEAYRKMWSDRRQVLPG
jgi:predicted O-linked N-acetylglucosamine transferase (SPINDLY family)